MEEKNFAVMVVIDQLSSREAEEIRLKFENFLATEKILDNLSISVIHVDDLETIGSTIGELFNE
jgi:hypothetical protein